MLENKLSNSDLAFLDRLIHKNLKKFKNGKKLVEINNQKQAEFLHRNGLELKFKKVDLKNNKMVWYFEEKETQ